MHGLEHYSYAEPAVAAFIVIPAILVFLLVWGTETAWQRSGAPHGKALRVALITGGCSAAWMVLTWAAADSGILRDWDRTPPPFFGLVLALLSLAFVIAFSGLGRRLAAFIPLWVLVAVQAFQIPPGTGNAPNVPARDHAARDDLHGAQF